MAVEAVLLDALGTLLRLEPPAPRLVSELRERGLVVDLARAERAFAAEIAYYRGHLDEGRDASTLAELRNRCASVLHDELGVPGVALADLRAAMLASISFTPYEDAAPALRELRGLGLPLVVASNWDFSLHDVLERAGLRELLDGVVTSAEVGVRKPGAALFEAALRVAGAAPAAALHAGDDPEADARGALAAGLGWAVLVDRDGRFGAAAPRAARVVRSLAELPGLVRAAAAPS